LLAPQFDSVKYADYFKDYVLYKWTETGVLQADEHLEEVIRGCTQNKVSPRRVGSKVARLHVISPTAGELFYLRCLLCRLAARSFAQLHTIDGVVYDSYHEAAIALGLFSNENEGHYALLDAIASFCPPTQLQFLFSRIVLEGFPGVPLWNELKLQLAQDFIRNCRSEEHGIDLLLQALQLLFQDAGRTLNQFGLPQPLLCCPEVVTEEETYRPRAALLRQEADVALQRMTDEQRNVFATVFDTVKMYASCHGNVPPPFFLEGKPGRGKMFVINAICTALRAENHIALIVGSSALAATLYEGGRTAHNLFAIPVTKVFLFSVNINNTLTFEQDNVALTSSIRPFSYRAEPIRAASFIAWDELPAANVTWMDCIDNLCRSLMKTDRPFGKIPFLGIGDFRQVAPVVKGTGCAPALQASVKSSSFWTSFHILKLHTPIRGARDPTYTSVVDDVGENFAEKTESLDILKSFSDTDACLTFLFPPDILADPLASLKRAFLTPKNVNVDEFNNIVLDTLPGDERLSFPLHGSNILLTSISDIFYSADTVKEDTEREHDEATPDYLSLQTHNGISGHLLRLKRGCVCTIMRNLSVRNSLVKNARIVVHNL
jgi:hypothetical protein